MMEIQEVFKRLEQEGFTEEKARVRPEMYGLGTLVNFSDAVNYATMYYIGFDSGKNFSVSGDHEVEWIGNKPKTKKLYACLQPIGEGGSYIAMLPKEEYEAEGLGAKIKWLSEDRYPPEDVEE